MVHPPISILDIFDSNGVRGKLPLASPNLHG